MFLKSLMTGRIRSGSEILFVVLALPALGDDDVLNVPALNGPDVGIVIVCHQVGQGAKELRSLIAETLFDKYLAAVNDGIVPLDKVMNSASDDLDREEKEKAERCLLYVAITRAQKGAYVLSYGRPSTFISNISDQ